VPAQQAAPVVVPPDDTTATTPDTASPATPDLDPDEAQICAYLRKHDSISRAQCERLLGVSRTQAKLRLQKMRDRGILRLEGTGNNIRYVLATDRRRTR
jgi:predicted HTH transcriptional regulator